jgi:hypothetical protein
MNNKNKKCPLEGGASGKGFEEIGIYSSLYTHYIITNTNCQNLKNHKPYKHTQIEENDNE